MSRRVGNILDPLTGEVCFMEPDLIHEIILEPKLVTVVGDNRESAIEFILGNNNEKKVITLRAEYSENGKKYMSDIEEMDENEFAEQFTGAVLSDKILDDTEIVSKAKTNALQNLTSELMDKGKLIGGMSFKGLGFIMVDNEKVMSIEELDFEYIVEGRNNESQQPIKKITMSNCVGQASLSNLNNPYVEFFTKRHKIVFNNLEIKEELEGRTKKYIANAEEMNLTMETTELEYENFENPDYENDVFLDSFIKSRTSLLDEETDDMSDVEDRFNLLF